MTFKTPGNHFCAIIRMNPRRLAVRNSKLRSHFPTHMRHSSVWETSVRRCLGHIFHGSADFFLSPHSLQRAIEYFYVFNHRRCGNLVFLFLSTYSFARLSIQLIIIFNKKKKRKNSVHGWIDCISARVFSVFFLHLLPASLLSQCEYWIHTFFCVILILLNLFIKLVITFINVRLMLASFSWYEAIIYIK